MDLFKRLLLTKFPNFGGSENMNPITMFIGFISAKEFFSIINRKIIENHRLNLFDINIDPVEFKMGFGENPNSPHPKEIESYFAYCSAANLNGHVFYSPANLSNALVLLASLYWADEMQAFSPQYFLHLLYTLYLLTFTITARIKVFPYVSEQENYNRFVELFFQSYRVTLEQLNVKILERDFINIKKKLLYKTDIFFLLFRAYQVFNQLLAQNNQDEDFLMRVLGEITEEKGSNKKTSFLQQYSQTQSKPDFSPLEQDILVNIWPADILVKYLFAEINPFLIAQEVISRIYDKKQLDPLVKSFVKSDDHLQQIFDYLLDYKKYKNGFFQGVQQSLERHFRDQGELEEIIQDLDEMISAIDIDHDNLSQFQVPERIKQESKITEKMINFYVTFLGGLTTARGDSFYFRLFKPELQQKLCPTLTSDLFSLPEQMQYYSKTIFLYNKNLYYYYYINQNIRLGKNKFNLPTHGKNIRIAPNFSVIRLYNQSMLATFFQEFNPRDTKLYIKNSELLQLFKDRFGETISQWLLVESPLFLENFYGSIAHKFFDSESFLEIVKPHIGEKELTNMKNNLYSLDYRINKEASEFIYGIFAEKNIFHPEYLFSLLASLKESFFGMLLLMHFLIKKSKKNEQILLMFWDFYFKEILNFEPSFYVKFYPKLQEIITSFSPFFDLWIQLDDNEVFFSILNKNIKKMLSKIGERDFPSLFSGDDRVWFKGVLKNITYYNRRYLIPNG